MGVPFTVRTVRILAQMRNGAKIFIVHGFIVHGSDIRLAGFVAHSVGVLPVVKP
jgi:hypothetical protein